MTHMIFPMDETRYLCLALLSAEDAKVLWGHPGSEIEIESGIGKNHGDRFWDASRVFKNT